MFGQMASNFNKKKLCGNEHMVSITQIYDLTRPINLFSLYVLFSQYRSCDNTLENCFFQILSYSRAYLRKESGSPGTSIGKTN